MLRKTRQWLAIIILACITFYFLDFSGTIPAQFHFLERIQLLPAIIALSVGIVCTILISTLILGRVYCSVICPLGIFQDVMNRIAKLLNKKKRFRYIKENRILRFSFLAFFIICFLLNAAFLVSLIEPYSIYGRIVTNLFRPVYWAANNLLALIFNAFGNYYFYKMDVYLVSGSSFVIALVSFVLIGYLSFRNGRIYCNTVCPAGTFLGYLSKFSILKIQIDPEKCNSCGLCGMKCKASCIDTKSHTVDHSRCVDCYNCLPACKSGAITYTLKKYNTLAVQSVEKGEARRRFLSMTALTTLSILKTQGEKISQSSNTVPERSPIVPPGGKSREHLFEHCTACHLCVSKCPSKVIKPSFTEYGLSGMMLPMMTYKHGFCNFDCTVCSEICPTKALEKVDMNEKHTLKLGEVNFVLERCIVYTDNTSCGACSEHCPTQAVSMVKYKGSLTIPHIKQEICVGCGGCEFICPSIPEKAIFVSGTPTHGKAKAIEKKETEEVELEDFGF